MLLLELKQDEQLISSSQPLQHHLLWSARETIRIGKIMVPNLCKHRAIETIIYNPWHYCQSVQQNGVKRMMISLPSSLLGSSWLCSFFPSVASLTFPPWYPIHSAAKSCDGNVKHVSNSIMTGMIRLGVFLYMSIVI